MSRHQSGGFNPLAPPATSSVRPSVTLVVVDTNVLLRDILYSVRKARRTTLVSLAASGSVKVFVTPDIVREVREHLPSFASQRGCSPGAALGVWHTNYEGVLQVVDPPPRGSDRLSLLQKRDPDDIPTARLIEILEPAVTLTEDRHLTDLGYAPDDGWLTYVLAVNTVAEKEALELGLALLLGLSGLAIYGSVAGIAYLVKKVPRAIWIGVAGVALLLALLPENRTNVRQSLRQVTEKLNSATLSVKQFSVQVFTQLAEAQDAAQAGYAQLAKVPASSVPRFARDYLLRVVARSKFPLTTDDILARMEVDGYKPRGTDPAAYVRRLLRSQPLVRRCADGRWELRTITSHDVS